MNKVIDKGFRSCRFVSTIVKHPVLDLICSKRFLFSLYLLNAVLKHLKLSVLFQKGSFNFSHIQTALSLCQKEIKNIADSDQVINSLKVDWGTISKFLPKSQSISGR